MPSREILVFKTNITRKKQATLVTKILHDQAPVLSCNVDLTDIDKVLRIESKGITSSEVIARLQDLGFICEELTD